MKRLVTLGAFSLTGLTAMTCGIMLSRGGSTQEPPTALAFKGPNTHAAHSAQNVYPAGGSQAVLPLKVSGNGRYLVDQNNVPVFWSGDAAWSLIAQGTTADMDYYLANRQQKGVNVILVNLIEHQFASNAPKDIQGDAPFTGAPFTTPNEAYFAHADYLISAAAQKGITVLLDPLYLGYGCGSEGWCAEVQAASSADLQSWGQYVGNRYKAFDNIVWVIGGDTDPTGVSAKVSAFATALQQADPRHVMTAHNGRGQMAVTPWTGASWLSVNDIYSTSTGTAPEAQSAYSLSPAKPFFQVEGYYENEHSMTTQQLRAQAYWTVLSGGMGYIFGNCPLWGFGAPASSFCTSPTSDWKTPLDGPGSVNMMHVAELFRARAWQNLVPDTRHTTLTAGYGTSGNTDYAPAERTADGSLVVAYLPTVRTVTVDMTTLAGPVTGQWYDPTTGTYSTITGSPFSTVGSHQFTPPGPNSSGDGDWILLLQKGGSSRPGLQMVVKGILHPGRTTTLNVTVSNSTTHLVVPGSKVTVDGRTVGISKILVLMTDTNGTATFQRVRPSRSGTATVQAAKSGFQSAKLSLTVR